MKIFLFSLSSLLLFPADGQMYHPFPEGTAIWKVIFTDYFPVPEVSHALYYGMEGDTLIDGTSYNKLFFVSNDVYNSEAAEYFGAIREDSAKKVFFIHHSSDEPRLLYDFGMSMHDTITVTAYDFNYEDELLFVLDTIYDYPVNDEGDMRKYYLLTEVGGSLYNEWIEGIGSLFGLFQLPYLATFGYGLGCVVENDMTVYGNGQCFIPTSLTETEQNPLRIYPTVSNGSFNVSNLQNNNIYTIELYTMHAQLLSAKEILFSGSVVIDFTGVTPGSYMIRIGNEKFSRTEMVIIR